MDTSSKRLLNRNTWIDCFTKKAIKQIVNLRQQDTSLIYLRPPVEVNGENMFQGRKYADKHSSHRQFTRWFTC